jgi:hypothetical protein
VSEPIDAEWLLSIGCSYHRGSYVIGRLTIFSFGESCWSVDVHSGCHWWYLCDLDDRQHVRDLLRVMKIEFAENTPEK